jgi:hypothetical protein
MNDRATKIAYDPEQLDFIQSDLINIIRVAL